MNDKLLGYIAKRMDKNYTKKQAKEAEEHPFQLAPGIELLSNIAYKTQDGAELMMDVYRPESRSGKLPVIVTVHGGALIVGNQTMYAGAAQILALKGFVVCCLDYRLLPNVRVYEEIADVCAGMDYVHEHLEELGGDPDKVYLISESAGAYLSIYANAMKYSSRLQQAVGYKDSKLNIRAMVLEGGMFYSNRKDMMLGITPTMYGRHTRAIAIKPYRNPEHSDVISHMPPCLLFTSDHDFLKKYTYDYAEALKKYGIECELVNMGPEKKLTHAFTVIHPEYEESKITLDKAAEWFSKH